MIFISDILGIMIKFANETGGVFHLSSNPLFFDIFLVRGCKIIDEVRSFRRNIHDRPKLSLSSRISA